MCLMSICFTIPEYTQKAIELILPVLEEESHNMKSQAIYSLSELFEAEFEPSPAILEYLIAAVAAHDGDHMVQIAQLVNRYAVHFSSLEMTPAITEYVQSIGSFFLETETDHPARACDGWRRRTHRR